MEESGENWPSDNSYLDEVNDEFGSEDEEGGSFSGMGETDRKKRKRELAERFLALSATIPGFTKMGEGYKMTVDELVKTLRVAIS
ncbi:uncharacterized protein LOC100804953 isoform 2 [Glycine max]|uniref:uncharacterized protein LOC100804953 isoform 2 n=1 Tax=Glycine max TaxID=3847 RepID=UPI0022AE944E|nr:uncharacterized protein LOC100804953 isoform 2 [Glycine max]